MLNPDKSINSKVIMRYIVTLLVAALLGVADGFAAPKLPVKCEAFRPKALNVILLREREALALANSKDYGQSAATAVSSYWIVYSDRADNQTYEGPSTTSAKFSTLEWNETLRIAKVQNGMALVYTEPQVGIAYPEISQHARCRGWVPMKNLLLWQSCLANDAGIYNKALLCVNLDESDANTENIGIGYQTPSTKGPGVQLTSDMNFYFIMKEENGMVLLADQSKMDGTQTDKVLYCWVPKQSYVPWNQRSCLEPTWKHEDVEYFADQQIRADVFENSRMNTEPISHIPFEKKEYERNQATQYIYRMEGAELRFPILDESSTVIYNLSTFSTYGGNAAGTGAKKKELTPQQKADSIQRAKLEKMQNINLAVVIDGTSSMGPYYPAVKESLLQAAEFFGTSYKLKIGIVIYRDYADERDGGLVEVMPMTSVRNTARIEEFLDKGGEYGIKSHPRDLTQEEALYYGINTALDELQFPEGESNMMLVVGDCGNDDDDERCVSPQELEAKIVERNIHMMGFQVRNQNNPAFSSFNNQMLTITRNSIRQNYQKYSDSIQVRPYPHLNEEQVRDGNDYKANVEHQLYIGSYRFANVEVNNGEMDPAKLLNHLTGAIADFSQTVQRQIDLIAAATKEQQKKGFLGSGKAGNLNIAEAFVRRQLGEDWAKLMEESGAVMNFRGFAEKKHMSGRDYFKPVIFISDEEFQDMLKRLGKVYEAARSLQLKDRTPYIDAMKALVRGLAPGITDNEMANLTNGEITQMIGGLNEAAESLNKYTLEDLSNPHVVTINDYNRIVQDFTRKYRNLSYIRQNKRYEYIKTFNGAKYFWIPIEELP